MPFQDYEIISTKRVNNSRQGLMSMFFNRLWLASGSYSTLYMSSLTGYAVYMHHAMFNPSIFHVLPKPVAGASAFAATFIVSIGLFGDAQEFRHLLRNYGTYRKEFKMIKEELYYA